MSEKTGKHRVLWVVVVIAIIAVVGYVAISTFMGKEAPVSTEQLLLRYVSNEQFDNCNAQVNVDMAFSALGFHAKVPVTANAQVAHDAAHGTVTADLSAFDVDDFQMEFYAELHANDIVCYLGTPDGAGTSWRRWTIPVTEKIDIFTLTNLLSASELVTIAKDSDEKVCYELTTSTTSVLETAFALSADEVAVGSMGEKELLEAVEGDKTLVDFSQDCLIRSFATNVMCDYAGPDTKGVTIHVKLEPHGLLDGYGTVDATAVAVPDEVKNAAVPTTEPIDLNKILGDKNPLLNS